MTDDIQQLINISDRTSAFEYLRNFNKRTMRLVACRMLHKGERDDVYISQVTFCKQEEIEELRSYLTITEAMTELELSEERLMMFIRQGLTVHNEKIPLFAIEIMKNDPSYFILMQKDYQEKKLVTQTKEEYIQELNERIAEYQEKYKGTFVELYGHLTANEIDEMDDSMELIIWKDFIEELREIREKKGE